MSAATVEGRDVTVNLKLIYYGALMGISNIIPGVSAGTIALIVGIYDELLVSVRDFFSPKIKRTLPFIIPLAIGVVGGILAFSWLISWLLTNAFEPVQFFFLGLILGVLPFLFREAEAKETFRFIHIVLLLAVVSLVMLMNVFAPEEGARTAYELTVQSGFWLFTAGIFASMSLLLPGLSGATVLLMFGVYGSAINALLTIDVPVILILVAGIGIGFIVSSRVIAYVLFNHRTLTYTVIIGLLIGSLTIVFPGISGQFGLMILSLLTFAGGFAIAFRLGKANDTMNREGVNPHDE